MHPRASQSASGSSDPARSVDEEAAALPGPPAEALPAIVWQARADGRLRYLNAAWFAFSGQSPQMPPNRAWLAALHPDDAERYARHSAALRAASEAYTSEVRVRRADGAYRTLHERAKPLSGGDWAGVCVEIDDGAQPRAPARAFTDSRLRRLFDANVMGIVIANNRGAIVEANDAYLAMIGYTRAELDAGAIDWRKLTPDEWLPLDERAIAELAAHGIMSQYEKEYVRKDGSRIPISLGGARLAGTDDEQICYIVDLSDIRRAEAALRRSESRFARLSDADVIGIITTRPSSDEIVEANGEFLRIIGSSRAQFAAGRIRLAAVAPPEFFRRAVGRFGPVAMDFLRADGEPAPVLVGGAAIDESNDEHVHYVLDLRAQRAATRQVAESERRYRVLAEALPQIIMVSNEDRRMVYVNRHYETYTGLSLDSVASEWRNVIHPDDLSPIERARATGESYEIEYRLRRADGVYRWHFARVLKIDDAAPSERWLAAAMDIDDRKRAEMSLRFIEEAGSRLSQSLDLNATFSTLLDLLVPDFGDWASINLRDEEGSIRTIVARHRDPAKTPLIRRISGVNYFADSHLTGTPGVYRTGQPCLVEDLPQERLRPAIKPHYLPIVEELGYASLIALPIFAGDEVIGNIGIHSGPERPSYRPADLPALQELARRAGFAIANARLYERERRVASELQAAALPRTLPNVPGFRFDAHYSAGRAEASIGGDWFDALVVADGRIVISVGDVAGSGLRAAVLMGNVRQVIRGAAHVYADPMMMLEIADRTLRSEHESSFVTAFVGVIDPRRRSILYASAGHLPALLRAPDGEISELTAPGLPLGCRNLGVSESRTALLAPGSCLLLYTDGLTEWSRDIIAGEALLRRCFADAAVCRGPQPAKRLVESVLPAAGARDDVAAVIVSVDEIQA